MPTARAVRALEFSVALTERDITNATLPSLDYAYDALEPHLSAEIMTLHHDKHHQAYITALNNAEAAYAKASTVKEQIALQQAIKFNGGGHINHSMFWKILAPSPEKGGNGGVLSDGAFKDAVDEAFGGIDNLKKEFNTATAAIQGSGWGWVGLNMKTNRLEITSTSNQDILLTHIPIIGVDVWEHAFYLQYKNVKADYLNAIWNVINFDEAENRFNEATKKA
ncbi:manganese superoxide dismutase [Marasmius fiardii PR-910]|nr:manganese superoxide dismutase [Marasmius fiardii PR-910]